MCCEKRFLALGIWLNQGQKPRICDCAAEGGCGPRVNKGRRIESQARVSAPQEPKSGTEKKQVFPKRFGVNKRDSPRISKEIHIDRKQHLGVSLKGSSLEVLAARRLNQK